MRSAHVLTLAGAIAAAHATTVHVVPQPLAVDPIVTSKANASLDILQDTIISSSDSVAASGWSISAACRDLALICESKAGAEIVVSSTSCSCLLNPNNKSNAAATNESSSGPAEVTAAGAIPQQVQSSMAGLLGFFIMCLVIL
ncbi:hypothetical protein B0I35DRAFT_408845 [Stachybotrys elegans]|uniref:Uncharacterized protein n=1 Tax=Stachybotrys elegans TaxID=80388 RepID=A0A8K0WRH0_9HYPO|nr:hypothetical protein B0I35DRAFT_408845 [Stachybotrys elegans]